MKHIGMFLTLFGLVLFMAGIAVLGIVLVCWLVLVAFDIHVVVGVGAVTAVVAFIAISIGTLLINFG